MTCMWGCEQFWVRGRRKQQEEHKPQSQPDFHSNASSAASWLCDLRQVI